MKQVGSDEIDLLVEMETKIFSPADAFEADIFKEVIAYWVIVDGEKIGSISFRHDSGYWDIDFPLRKGCLYITSTGLLPEWRGKGFGSRIKAWEIEYAKDHGFKVVVTNCRESNKAIIGLNKKFGFRVVKIQSDYYTWPTEPTVVMELELGSKIDEKTEEPRPDSGRF